MRVFVTGATGYIGRAVASIYARAGHEVHGLVRTVEKARSLEECEVFPVVGSMQDPGSFSKVAGDCQILIHCAVEYSEKTWELHKKTVEALLDAAVLARRPRKLIVTSGVWVYGDTGTGVADEGSQLNPPYVVLARPESDDSVLRANGGNVQTLVIRPGCVYGGSGGLTSSWFESAIKAGAARLVGDGSNRWAMVHLQDLAQLYLKAGEAILGGEVFNATDRSRFTVADCAEAASRAAGAGGKTERIPLADALRDLGPIAECLTLNQHVDSMKAVRLLDWNPRHGGFVDGAARYFAAWKANR